MNPAIPAARVSVVIPTYNQGDYLAEAVDSVYAQEGVAALEVIVIDDGSTDHTPDVARALLARYPDLRLVRQDNAGVCAACNHGLSLATGEYLLRLDADDYLPPGYVAALLRFLERQPAEVAYAFCDAEYVGARRGRMPASPYSLARLVQYNFIHVSALVRAEAVRAVGYYNPNMRHGLEDWDLWLTLAERGRRGAYCRDTRLFYRQKVAVSRNHMPTAQWWAMRRQVYANHPALYRRPFSRLLLLFWRAKREARRLALVLRPAA